MGIVRTCSKKTSRHNSKTETITLQGSWRSGRPGIKWSCTLLLDEEQAKSWNQITPHSDRSRAFVEALCSETEWWETKYGLIRIQKMWDNKIKTWKNNRLEASFLQGQFEELFVLSNFSFLRLSSIMKEVIWDVALGHPVDLAKNYESSPFVLKITVILKSLVGGTNFIKCMARDFFN